MFIFKKRFFEYLDFKIRYVEKKIGAITQKSWNNSFDLLNFSKIIIIIKKKR